MLQLLSINTRTQSQHTINSSLPASVSSLVLSSVCSCNSGRRQSCCTAALSVARFTSADMTCSWCAAWAPCSSHTSWSTMPTSVNISDGKVHSYITDEQKRNERNVQCNGKNRDRQKKDKTGVLFNFEDVWAKYDIKNADFSCNLTMSVCIALTSTVTPSCRINDSCPSSHSRLRPAARLSKILSWRRFILFKDEILKVWRKRLNYLETNS